jgi:serine/threonine protein kinase
MISVGSVVAKYVVRAKIGEGAMGTVYLAQHRELDTRVAIKVIRRDGSETEEDASRFFTEARAASRIGHENIVGVLDVGRTDDGDPFYIMELLTGESLMHRLARGRRPLEEVLHVAVQIAGALAASHAKGIVHRDLKPANVFLIRRGADASFVKVLDFGVAKLTDEKDKAHHHRTQTGRLLGTPHYMAPEQVAGRRAVDGRADVYALGVMLFEMVCGRLPFDAPKWTEVLIQHVTQSPPRAREHNVECPAWLDRLIDKALAKSPTDRPTMAAMRDALRLGDGGELVAEVSAPADPDEITQPGPRDTLPRPDAAETLVEAKSPSNPVPGAGSNPTPSSPPLLSGPLAEEIAAAETMASTDPQVAGEARAKLAARGRRRMLVAAGLGSLLGAGALVGGAFLLGGRAGGEVNAAPAPDAGPLVATGAAERMLRKRLHLKTQRELGDLTLPGAVDLEPAPPSPPDAGPFRAGVAAPPRSDVQPWIDASTSRPPGRLLDAHDIHSGLFPTIDTVQSCRNRYAPDEMTLAVRVRVRGEDGWVESVHLAPRWTGTQLELCVVRAVRQEARFPVFLSERQEVAYDYAFVDLPR